MFLQVNVTFLYEQLHSIHFGRFFFEQRRLLVDHHLPPELLLLFPLVYHLHINSRQPLMRELIYLEVEVHSPQLGRGLVLINGHSVESEEGLGELALGGLLLGSRQRACFVRISLGRVHLDAWL